MRHLTILAALFVALFLSGCGNGVCTNGEGHIEIGRLVRECPSGGSGDAGDPIVGDPCDTDFDCPEDAFCDDSGICSDDLVDDCDPEDEDEVETPGNDNRRNHHLHRHHRHHNGQNGHIDTE